MVKNLFRSFAIHALAIWLVAQNLGGVEYNNDIMILALAGIALTLVDSFIKPILNLLLLPFNLITLGTFRWVVNVFTLYITTLLVRGFSIVSFSYLGANIGGFIVPTMDFSVFWAYVMVALSLSVISSFLYWLVD